MPQSGDEKATGTSEELPCHKQRNRMPLAKLLKGGWQEAFTKDSNLVQRARGAYFRMNCPDFDHEILHNLSHTFWEMVDSAGLLKSDIYEVQDAWMGQKELCTTNHTAKASQRNIQFFCMVTPTEFLSIMGLEGIHSSEALCSRVATHTAHGVPKKGKMREPWLTTSKQSITT